MARPPGDVATLRLAVARTDWRTRNDESTRDTGPTAFSLARDNLLAILPNYQYEVMSSRGEDQAVDHQTLTRYEARARVIKALAHPTRLFIVEELARGERCVCELREMVGADLSTVSKHLAVLKNAGILSDERRGAQVFYRLRVPCVLNFFGCVEALLRPGPQQ